MYQKNVMPHLNRFNGGLTYRLVPEAEETRIATPVGVVLVLVHNGLPVLCCEVGGDVPPPVAGLGAPRHEHVFQEVRERSLIVEGLS